jgi:glycosyltransferase involved in cell wall biosynthesis
MERGKITLSMVVKNESERFLRDALVRHKTFIDEAVIIDDGSTDNTPELCHEVLAGIPMRFIRNDTSKFHNEVTLRKQQWDETILTAPQWILNLDADEMFEASFDRPQIDVILNQTDYDVFYFRLYDMWSKTQYRDDNYWQAHHFYRPFLVRYRSDLPYFWKETPQHCGRFPLTIGQFSYQCHPARIQHFGWALKEDRVAKYERYQLLDPDARYGWKEQYDSILDESPILVKWEG